MAIKSELGIFADSQSKTFGDHTITIANDELIITDRQNNLFEYKVSDGRPLNDEMQRLQSTLFHEKQKLIENCLFGVDINPNSVKICRLRLWIELLKNAYYNYSELETLPNIDINIKEGNSLISRYNLHDKFKTKKTKEIIEAYRAFTKTRIRYFYFLPISTTFDTISFMMKNPIILVLLLLTFSTLETFPQVDSDTLLSLRFENSLNGESGEIPVSSSLTTFQTGVSGQAVALPAGGHVSYQAANNINSREGTIEFWIQPNWNGNDGLVHPILDWNGNGFGGMLFSKNELGNLGLSMDRYVTWQDVAFNASNWRSGEWHSVAITFSNTTKKLQIYTDGALRGEKTFTVELPVINASLFQVGASPTNASPLNAQLDELRISNRVRTATEIQNRFLSALTITSIDLAAVTKTLWPTWRVPFTVTAQTNIGSTTIPTGGITLSSSDATKATMDSDGFIRAGAPGAAVLTARIQQAERSISVQVKAPARLPTVTVPTDSRAVPAANALFEIPVLVIRYLPTEDGVNLDTSWAPSFFSLSPITVSSTESKLNSYDQILKFMLEDGSRFRSYGNQTVSPSLGYRIVAEITVYEPTPPGKPIFDGIGYSSEYFQIFERLGIRDYIENSGVKEIWFASSGLNNTLPSYNPVIHPAENFRAVWESNMSSPTTSDVSNSNGDNSDLPIYNHTYFVYYQDLRRFDQVTTHIFGHQLESMFSSVNFVQDGNANLFRTAFEGADGQIRGRAGSIHYPPNGQVVYDYNNFNPYDSDIKDWKPDNSGQKVAYSAATARDTPYLYPNTFLGPSTPEANWYLFWYQSVPGLGNTIPYVTSAARLGTCVDTPTTREIYLPRGDGGEIAVRLEVSEAERRDIADSRNNLLERSDEVSAVNRITNWWLIYADWDRARRSGFGLYEPASCGYALSATNQSFPASGGTGNVSVTSSAGCKWFASNNAKWTPLMSGDIGNGSGQVSFTVQPNTTASPRATRIIVAGQPFTINQIAAQNPVTVGGRVTTPAGLGLRNAVVSITDSFGVRRTATTSSFGVYSFANVAIGESYTISVSSKRYRFAARNITITENLSNLDFVGLE